jgi:hypothetical protein
MSQRFVLSAVCIGLAITTFLLWMRVQALSDKVDSLTQQLKSQPKAVVLPVEQARSSEKDPERQGVFRLIETKTENGTTEVGVPWSVERAMIGEAQQNNLRSAPLHESEPVIIELKPTAPEIRGSVPSGFQEWLNSSKLPPSAED